MLLALFFIATPFFIHTMHPGKAEHRGYYKQIIKRESLPENPRVEQTSYLERIYKISPVLGATIEEDINKLKEALIKGNNPDITNEKGETALYLITSSVPKPDKQKEFVELLLQYGANPLKKTTGGLRPNENALEAAQRLERNNLVVLFKNYSESKHKTK